VSAVAEGESSPPNQYNSAKAERLEALAKSFHVDTAAIRVRRSRCERTILNGSK
jgi:hypothetical protein